MIEDLDLPNPVIRSHYGNGSIKQYVRDHLLLRTEAATNNVNDYGVTKAVAVPPRLAEAWPPSTIPTSRSNRTSWRPSSTAASCANSPSRPRLPTANASRAEARSSAPARRDARAGPLRPHCGGRYLHHRGPPPGGPTTAALELRPSSTGWRRCATTCRSSGPSAWSRACRTRALSPPATATRSVSSS